MGRHEAVPFHNWAVVHEIVEPLVEFFQKILAT